MNNRITELFKKKKENVLSVFFTAGYPALNDTTRILQLLEQSGADMVEIGMPFSDPLADGPVIQRSSEIALENGMSVSLLFDQLAELRKAITIPVVLMGYLNPVMQFGMESFVKRCVETGVDGVILPDLPPGVYTSSYKTLFERNNLSKIFLVTPSTSEERLRMIDDASSGFVYLVSSSGTTGKKASFDEANYERIKSMELKNPLMIGFGISDSATFKKAGRFASGAVIGTAFIRAISEGNAEEKVPAFISSILN